MAAKTPSAIGRPPKRHVATLHPTDTVLDEIFNELDAVQKRLVAAQDEEQAKLPPIDWTTAQQELAEERARLLVTGGNAIDQIMCIAELGVGVARQVAGVEAAARMAGTQPPQAALPPPPPDRFDGGDDTEDFSALSKEPWRRQVSFYPPPDEDWGFDADPPTKPSLAVRVAGWWRRVWTPIKTGLQTPALLLWGAA